MALVLVEGYVKWLCLYIWIGIKRLEIRIETNELASRPISLGLSIDLYEKGITTVKKFVTITATNTILSHWHVYLNK